MKGRVGCLKLLILLKFNIFSSYQLNLLLYSSIAIRTGAINATLNNTRTVTLLFFKCVVFLTSHAINILCLVYSNFYTNKIIF